MPSPFAFGSPRIPAAPQSTPVTSSGAYFLAKPRAPRPPVVNPYDRFSQVEFDDWISNITGALRKALGHENDEPDRTTVESDSASPIFNRSPRGIHARTHSTLTDEEQEEYETDEEGVNDSLADIRVRFNARLDKGKARDPMEGPGFPISGKGDKDAPIEIDLDEDESEHDGDSVDQSLQETDDSDVLDDEEVALHLSFVQPSDGEEEEEEEELNIPQASPGSERHLKEGDEDEYDESDVAEGSSERQQGSDNVIELLLSDDEAVAQASTPAQPFVGQEKYSDSEEGDAGERMQEDENSSFEREESPQVVYENDMGLSDVDEYEEDLGDEDAEDNVEDEKEGSENEESDEEEEVGVDEQDESGLDEEDEDDQSRPFSICRKPSPEIIDLDSDIEEDQLIGNSDRIQPLEHDTSFPPHHDDLQTPIEIRNPWLGPQMYAEDYYAGGPILPQGPDVLHNPHILSADDDREGFLTPENVILAESNEREVSASEELQQPTVPSLYFVHGQMSETWSEMPPETDFVAGAASTVQTVNVAEANAIFTRDEGLNEPIIIETQDENNNFANADSAQEKESLGKQAQFHHSILLETTDHRALPSQETGKDDAKEVIWQSGATSVGVYEEIRAGITYERQEGQTRLQPEGAGEVSRPLHSKVPSVTVEDATDDEAENEYLGEGEDMWILPVLPLCAGDLDTEAAIEDSRPIMTFDDTPSLTQTGTELAIDDNEAQDLLSTAAEVADGGNSQTLSNVVEATISEPVELHVSTIGVLERVEPSDQLPTLTNNSLLTNVIDTVIESEPEQQLPTPPSEQEVLPCAPMKHSSPETQPAILVEEDETPVASMAEEEKSSQHDSRATLIEQSPLTPTASLEKGTPAIPSTDDDRKSANLPTLIAVEVEEKVSDMFGFDQKMLDQQSIGQVGPVLLDADLSPSVATLVSDLAIQDVTEDVVTMEVIDYMTVVEEVPSKATSEEPEFLDKHTASGSFSKEGSVVSLPFSDCASVSPGLFYLVEELPDDGVTDEDADGEVDPDLGITSIQDIASSGRWNDLADEIFDANLWDLGEPFFPEPHIEADAMSKKDSVVCTMEQTEHLEVQEIQPDSQLTLVGENSTEPTKPESSSGGPVPDEDDIASSRETSPSPIHPTRSPSPTTSVSCVAEGHEALAASLSQSPPSESEKELYGEKSGSKKAHSHEVGLADETVPFVKEMTPDIGVDDASTTVPGLTLAASLRPTSPIPGLGARLLEDAGTEAADGEIPGLTWSKTFPSLMPSKDSSMPPRPASCPQDTSPTQSPSSLKQAHEWLMTHVPHVVTRRATEPVLFSDPYPYSLSTPGLDNAKDEVGDTEDEEEQDMSMSSSSTSLSAEKDPERDTGEQSLETDGGSEGKLYVGVPAAGGNKPEETRPGLSQDLIEPVETIDGYFMNFNDADQDRDADGDLDPDFVVLPEITVGPNQKSTMPGAEPTEAPPDVTVPEAKEGPLYIQSESATERPSESQQPPSSLDNILSDTATASDHNATSEMTTLTVAPESVQLESNEVQTDKNRVSPELHAIGALHLDASRPTEVVQETVICSSPQSISPPQADETNEKRISNGKRKRSPTPQAKVAAQVTILDQPSNAIKSRPSQIKRSQSSQMRDRTKRPRTASTTNRTFAQSDSDDSVLLSELTAPSDDEVSLYGLLHGDNAESSRTPTAALSPPTENAVEHFYPMLHRHGRGAKNQSRQLLPSQRSIQKLQSPSRPRSSDKPHPHLDPSHIPSASQRATRSNCRYRKISVPREEDGPRVCFLVPGCSLGDEEVIEENEIEDLGEATYADSLRMVRDIESLFDSYLIGVLRQLVGVDLLREQEVFYLPAPGEEPVIRKLPKRSLSDKSSLSKKPSKSGNVDTSSVLSTPSRSVTSAPFKSPSSSKAPISHSSATSTSISTARRGPKYERDSLTPTSPLSLSSSDEEKEIDDIRRRPKPRPKYLHKAERDKRSEHLAKGGKIPKRRLTSDAMAYKPHSDSEDNSSTDDNATRLPQKVTALRRGLKRTRSGKSFAVSGETDGRESKKIKRDQ